MLVSNYFLILPLQNGEMIQFDEYNCSNGLVNQGPPRCLLGKLGSQAHAKIYRHGAVQGDYACQVQHWRLEPEKTPENTKKKHITLLSSKGTWQWKIAILNYRRYIFKIGCFSIVMLVFGGAKKTSPQFLVPLMFWDLWEKIKDMGRWLASFFEPCKIIKLFGREQSEDKFGCTKKGCEMKCE